MHAVQVYVNVLKGARRQFIANFYLCNLGAAEAQGQMHVIKHVI